MRQLIAIATVLASVNCVWVEKTVRPPNDTPAEISVSTHTVEPGNGKSEPVITTTTTEVKTLQDVETRGSDKLNNVRVPGTDKGRRDKTTGLNQTVETVTMDVSGQPGVPRITDREERVIASKDVGDSVTISGFMSPTDAINLYQSESATRAALADKQIAFDRTRDGFEQRNVVGTNGAVLPNQYGYGGMFGGFGNGPMNAQAINQMMAQQAAFNAQSAVIDPASTWTPPQIIIQQQAPPPVTMQAAPGAPTQNNGQPQPVSASTSGNDEELKKLKDVVEQLSAGFAAFMNSGEGSTPNAPVTQQPQQKGGE